MELKIDDLEIFGANSQSVIFCSLAAPNWESVRNAMLMCEKFSPFEVSGGRAESTGGGASEARRPIMGCQERVGGAPIL